MAKNTKLQKEREKNDNKKTKWKKKKNCFCLEKKLKNSNKKDKRSKENLPSWRNLKFQACSKLFNLQKWKRGEILFNSNKQHG